MKHWRIIFLVILALLMTGLLAACGSEEEEEATSGPSATSLDEEFPDYEAKTMVYTNDLGSFNITIYGDKLVYNENTHTDDLLLYMKVVNTGEYAQPLCSVANIVASQSGDILTASSLVYENGEPIYNDYTRTGDAIGPGESRTYITGWELNSPETIVFVEFKSWRDNTPAGNLTFQVSGRMTPEYAAYKEENPGPAVTGPTNQRQISYETAEVYLPDGWFIDRTEDSSIWAKNNTLNAKMNIEWTEANGTGAEWAKSIQDSLGEGRISSLYVKRNRYTTLTLNDNEKIFFLDCPSGGVVKVYAMYADETDLKPLLGNIATKKRSTATEASSKTSGSSSSGSSGSSGSSSSGSSASSSSSSSSGSSSSTAAQEAESTAQGSNTSKTTIDNSSSGGSSTGGSSSGSGSSSSGSSGGSSSGGSGSSSSGSSGGTGESTGE